MTNLKIRPRPRPDVTRGTTEKIPIYCGKIYVTINEDTRGICEIIIETGKYGGCRTNVGVLGRVLSIALRSGIEPKVLIKQLENSPCPAARRSKKKSYSCPDAIAIAIKKRREFKVCLKKKQKRNSSKRASALPNTDKRTP